MLYLLTFISLGLFFLSLKRDNRSLLNPALLIISLVFAYFSLASFFYTTGWNIAHDLMYGLAFILLPLLLLASGFFLIYNGFILLKREGKSKANLLSLAMGLAITFFWGLILLRFTDRSGIFYQNILVNQFFLFIMFSYLLFGFAFAGFMLYSYLYLFIPKRKHYDFIIIHGAGLLNGETVTPLLKKRIDKAVEAYHRLDNPQIKLIASGGQGPDEKVSEAQAIANYLATETNIPAENILLEDRSRTTYENLLFSKQLGEELVANPHFLFVTNDYHVFRTSAYARQIGLKGDGLGCATASYYIPSAFIREYIAICVKLKWVFLAFYLPYLLGMIITYHGILW